MRVRLEEVTYQRDTWCLHGVGTFEPGLHLITGKIGSGKTTLAHILSGLIQPNSGEMIQEEINSKMLSMQFPEHQITAGTIEAEISSWGLDPKIILPAELQGRMTDDPLALSRGEMKRLHLSCVLSREWDLLVLDEPFSSLDCRQKSDVCRNLERVHQRITIVLTHEQCILPRVDTLWEMVEGRLEHRGSIPDALSRWSEPPSHIRYALEKGVIPGNIRLQDVEEALCRTQE